MIVDNSKVNKGPVMTYRMFKEYFRGYQNVDASLEDFKNFSRDIKKFLSEGDAQMLTEHFMKIKRMCPSFYFDFEVDEKDLGIEGGLKKVFKDKVQHRYCIWHILKKLPEKVGPVICKETEFLKEINSCVWGKDMEPAEFEERWTAIVEAHELSDNEWLQEKYGIRQFWIPAYFPTPLDLEKHAAETYTPRIFDDFKEEIKAACFTCATGDKEKWKNHAILYIDVKDRERKKDYKSPANCDELLTILRGFKERVLVETTSSVADDGGNSSIGKKRDKNAEIGMLLGTSVPSEIKILPPRQCKNKGSGKRMISQRERAGGSQ
ncbi:protein FAR1-RELATED SEQUENCE 4-like [Silene latifolia]|uniref:protein FAR1-RELATED SEQUENCE 4-like n=1 Tax=Silene latifolia TaxID=37657 RepID=UPI003D774D34